MIRVENRKFEMLFHRNGWQPLNVMRRCCRCTISTKVETVPFDLIEFQLNNTMQYVCSLFLPTALPPAVVKQQIFNARSIYIHSMWMNVHIIYPAKADNDFTGKRSSWKKANSFFYTNVCACARVCHVYYYELGDQAKSNEENENERTYEQMDEQEKRP